MVTGLHKVSAFEISHRKAEDLRARASSLRTLVAVVIGESQVLKERAHRLRMAPHVSREQVFGKAETESEPEFLWCDPDNWTVSFIHR